MSVSCEDCGWGCGWGQDDFYNESYNPDDYLLSVNCYLFGNKKDQIDKQYTDDYDFVQENGPITTREVIARKFERYANRIRQAKWLNREDFKNDPNPTCPKCGSKNIKED